jgi:hypothetical protein
MDQYKLPLHRLSPRRYCVNGTSLQWTSIWRVQIRLAECRLLALNGQASHASFCPLLDQSRQSQILAQDGLSANDPTRTLDAAFTRGAASSLCISKGPDFTQSCPSAVPGFVIVCRGAAHPGPASAARWSRPSQTRRYFSLCAVARSRTKASCHTNCARKVPPMPRLPLHILSIRACAVMLFATLCVWAYPVHALPQTAYGWSSSTVLRHAPVPGSVVQVRYHCPDTCRSGRHKGLRACGCRE